MNPSINESVDLALEMHVWGKKGEAEDQEGCLSILAKELLPLKLDGIDLGLFDVRSIGRAACLKREFMLLQTRAVARN